MFEKMDSSPKSGQYNPEYNLKPHKNKKSKLKNKPLKSQKTNQKNVNPEFFYSKSFFGCI